MASPKYPPPIPILTFKTPEGWRGFRPLIATVVWRAVEMPRELKRHCELTTRPAPLLPPGNGRFCCQNPFGHLLRGPFTTMHRQRHYRQIYVDRPVGWAAYRRSIFTVARHRRALLPADGRHPARHTALTGRNVRRITGFVRWLR